MDVNFSPKVTRGAESWQFFAFIFGSVAALGLSVIDDLVIPVPAKIVLRILWFALCFCVIMLNLRVRNKLARFLGWLKEEQH